MVYRIGTDLTDLFIQDGDNWILSAIHNSPHNALADNSDDLKDKLDRLANKLGLSIMQEKRDGFPIFHSTYYIKSGLTYVEALSVLDKQLKLLEELYRIYLYRKANEDAVAWEVSKASNSVVSINTNDYPAPLDLIDFGSFRWMTYRPNKIYTTLDLESRWNPYSKTFTDIFGQVYALETITSVEGHITSSTTMDLYQFGWDSSESYTKRISAIIDHDSQDLNFNYYATPASVIVKKPESTNPIGYSKGLYSGENIVYIFPILSAVATTPYLLDREERLINASDVIQYRYYSGAFTQYTRVEGITIQGITTATIDRFSYAEIKPIHSGKLGMVLADEFGNIVFRESSDGHIWSAPSGSTNQGLIVAATSGFEFDYPTFVTAEDGFIVFYNTDYTNGTLDDIHYAYSRDFGDSWTIPPEYLDIVGTIPYFYRSQNGNMYLYYWNFQGVAMDRIYLTVGI